MKGNDVESRRKGATIGQGCAVLLLLPMAWVLFFNVFLAPDPLDGNGMTRAEAAQDAIDVARGVAWEAQNKPVTTPDPVPVSIVEPAVVSTSTPAPEPVAVNRLAELKADAAALLKDKAAGEMILPASIGGVAVGDAAENVLKYFGEPTAMGPTDEREFFATGWPGQEFVAYMDDRIAFIYSGGEVKQIVAGVGRTELMNELPVGPEGSNMRVMFHMYGSPDRSGVSSGQPSIRYAYWEKQELYVVFNLAGDQLNKIRMTKKQMDSALRGY